MAKRNGETRLPKRQLNSRAVLVVNVHPLNAGLPLVEDLLEYARNRAIPFESLYGGSS